MQNLTSFPMCMGQVWFEASSLCTSVSLNSYSDRDGLVYVLELLSYRGLVRATITLYPIGRLVRATITLYPIGRPVRATNTLYPIGDLLELLLHCIL